MTPKEFTKTQTVNVIYDPNGMYILEEHVYGLMQKYADQQLILSGVMHPLPDLKSKSLPLFLEEYKNLASKDVLTKVWEYGNNQWENGYSQGKYNPDFD